MNRDKHIEERLEFVKSFFVEIDNRINALKPDGVDRIPQVGTCEVLEEKFGRSTNELYALLKIFLDGCPGVNVKAGSKGGIHRLPEND